MPAGSSNTGAQGLGVGAQQLVEGIAGVQRCVRRLLNQTLTNDLRKLAPGQGQYTLMCNERGGVIDDLYAYRLAAKEYLLIINASRIEADVAWLEKQLAAFARRSEVKLQNASDATGAVAVQGPRVVEFIDGCFPGPSTGGTQRGAGDGFEEEPGCQLRPCWRRDLGLAHRLHGRGRV